MLTKVGPFQLAVILSDGSTLIVKLAPQAFSVLGNHVKLNFSIFLENKFSANEIFNSWPIRTSTYIIRIYTYMHILISENFSIFKGSGIFLI